MTLALVHAALTLFLTGLIWFVQIVHYPLLARLGGGDFAAHQAFHVRRTTSVVAPAMLGEAATAAWLAVAPPVPAAAQLAAVGFVLLLVVWLSTALVQVPCHRRLERGFDPATARRLIGSNWVRTAAWTARGGVALAVCAATADG